MDTYSLAFSVSNFGPKAFQKILSKFEGVQEAWEGSKEEYESIGINGKTFVAFEKFRNTFNCVQYTGQLTKAGVEFVSFLDKNYPKKLKKLENPPIGIYAKGNIDLINNSQNLKLAVVGTRKVTQYGKEVTEFLVCDLVSNNVCIISGLALGVDGIAHRTAISNNGLTIAVLGCGVDCCRPSENYGLYSQILKNNGLIISEYPLLQPPNKGTFLARNRIIAALSDGVLITEAAKGSGSLVTAQWGLKLGKKVFAVPGQITSRMSDGSLELLKKGAKLVSNTEDILEEFSNSKSQVPNKSQKINFKKMGLNNDDIKIIKLLERQSLTIDEIAKKTKLPVSKLFASISNLELREIVKNNRGKISVVM